MRAAAICLITRKTGKLNAEFYGEGQSLRAFGLARPGLHRASDFRIMLHGILALTQADPLGVLEMYTSMLPLPS